jgi:hypothetical protein
MLKPTEMRVTEAVRRQKESDFPWADINSFKSVHEMFCDVQGP